MATFDQNITAIKQAQYGYEVRDAIAEGLTQCFDKVAYHSLDYEEIDLDDGGKEIDIIFPNNRKIAVHTSYNKSGKYYAVVGFKGQNSCYYANFTPNPTYTIEKLYDGSILVNLSSTQSELTKTTKIRVGYDAIETSVLITSTSESSAGLGNVAEIMLNRVKYSGGYDAKSSSTYYPGTITNPSYIPIEMIDFGGPGECLQVYSGVKTTFDGRNLYRDLSTGGRVGCHFYTKFVYDSLS